MEEASGRAWWRGRRGEWYVVVQIVLFALVAFGPRTWHEGIGFLPPVNGVTAAVGIGIAVAGGALSLAAVIKVGRHLTPLPQPVEGAKLHQVGVYRWVRHPMYCGVWVAALGWSIIVDGPLTFVYAVLLFVLFDLKSRREEAWLRKAYADYEEYARRVRRLIPFVY